MNLNVEKIKRKLNTILLGRNIKYYEMIDSTQNEAKRITKNDYIENGTYIVTDKQTNGKGTNDRKWYDSTGENICGTFVLKPNCNIKKIEGITILIANCIVTAIYNLYNIDLKIKYPNDIMCNGKKMCGILTESVTNAEIVQYIYVGIGINVNQTNFNSEIENIATSLKHEYDRDFVREDIIAEFFNIFEEKYLDLIK